MNRRGLMGMVAALALAAFSGVSTNAADSKVKAKEACACCGADCACATCSCDAKAKVAGKACDCCDEATCCSAKANKSVVAPAR